MPKNIPTPEERKLQTIKRKLRLYITDKKKVPSDKHPTPRPPPAAA